MNLRPLRTNIVLQVSEQAVESKIGLIIADSVQNQGIVVAIGKSCKEIKLGDKIRFDPNSAVSLDNYKMCREEDVLCVIEE